MKIKSCESTLRSSELGAMELENDRKSEDSGKLERQRQLNVIYFVDASKTHSFRVPMKTGVWIAAALAVIVLWAFVGSLVLLREALITNAQGERIQELLDTVFQYQTRYDGVYEKAYPKDIHERKNQRLVEDDVLMEGDNPATQENEAELALAAKNAPKVEKKAADKKDGPLPKNFAVEIAEIKATLKPSLLQVSFNMRNNRKPDLSSGTLWGIATYQSELDAIKHFLTAPMGMQLTEDGETASFRGGYRFSIRYFNSRTLTFPTPQMAGAYKTLRIFLADDKNRQTYVSVPLHLSTEQPEQSIAMPLHVEYNPPIRSTSSADAVPQRRAKPAAPAPAQDELRKNLTVPKEKPDNGAKSEQLIQEPHDEDLPINAEEGKTAAPPAPTLPEVIEEEQPVESAPTIIDDGPSE